MLRTVLAVSEAYIELRQQLHHRAFFAQRQARPRRGEADRSVHSAGVHVDKAEARGSRLGDCALARA